jgi:hypothetical protein
VGAFAAVFLDNPIPATRLERGLDHVVGEDEPHHTPQALAPELDADRTKRDEDSSQD